MRFRYRPGAKLRLRNQNDRGQSAAPQGNGNSDRSRVGIDDRAGTESGFSRSIAWGRSTLESCRQERLQRTSRFSIQRLNLSRFSRGVIRQSSNHRRPGDMGAPALNRSAGRFLPARSLACPDSFWVSKSSSAVPLSVLCSLCDRREPVESGSASQTSNSGLPVGLRSDILFSIPIKKYG